MLTKSERNPLLMAQLSTLNMKAIQSLLCVPFM
jgi:hypothetical protein